MAGYPMSSYRQRETTIWLQKMVGLFWRFFLKSRYLLFQRHRHNQLVLEHVGGRPFMVLPQVFNPALFYTSEFLAKSLNEEWIPPGASLLDMGTGAGIGAVFAAQWACEIIAVDVNPHAVRCANINFLLNRVEDKVEARLGDLYDPVRGLTFDVILFNPPYYQGEPTNLLEHAFYASAIPGRFSKGLLKHLAPNGSCLMVLSTAGNPGLYLDSLLDYDLLFEEVKFRRLFSETLTIYRIRREIDDRSI